MGLLGNKVNFFLFRGFQKSGQSNWKCIDNTSKQLQFVRDLSKSLLSIIWLEASD